MYKDYNKNLYIYGLSRWGFQLIKHFFKPKKVFFIRSFKDLRKAKDGVVLMYPTYKNEEIILEAKSKNIPVGFVEDGFIRSLTLGSSFFKPASIVVDYRGIYYDPSEESDLEYFLNTYECSEEEIKRAKLLKKLILESKISKYNHLKTEKLNIKSNKKIILVVGQVDDDMSIIKAGFGLDSFKLLKKVKEENSKEFIIYKPHPDVVAKIREGFLDIKELKKYADEVIIDYSLDSCFEISDEVHTISSLSGFEALLRNKNVIVHGLPFYAGWGLTEDKRICNRRKRRLSIEELLFISYIKYPRYVSLKTNEITDVETVIKEIKEIREKYFRSKLFRFKISLLGKSAVLMRKFYGMLK